MIPSFDTRSTKTGGTSGRQPGPGFSHHLVERAGTGACTAGGADIDMLITGGSVAAELNRI